MSTQTSNSFKEAFGKLAAGVSVVTFEAGPHIHGFTATSVTSVSMDPPLALFCVGAQASSHAHLRKGLLIGISILAADQKSISNRFAKSAEPGSYADVAIDRGIHGATTLKGAIATIEAQVVDTLRAGDHTIFLCSLRSAKSASGSEPLLYHARGYHTLAPLAETLSIED
jgi:flavin reductase (DIM6/NTAB) family NADH-FMN oxidoreductase RutF